MHKFAQNIRILGRSAWLLAIWASPAAIAQNTVIIQNHTTVIVNAPRTTPSVVLRPLPYSAPPLPHYALTYKTQELWPYMTPRCAQLSEALQKGPVRGTGFSDYAGMREEYQNSCADDELQARQKLFQQKMGHQSDIMAQKSAAQEASAQSQLTREQCDELLGILAAKRKRLDTMTEGEKADHKLFEANYKARCTAH